jgi:hypothetical protein
MKIAMLCCLALLLVSCGEAEKPQPPAKKTWKEAGLRPVDETRFFPSKERLAVEVIPDKLLGHDFLPGGNVATYKRGAKEYRMFVVKMRDANAAAMMLFEYKDKLGAPKFVASFGGYFGDDGGTPAFLFSKNAWVCGVLGLNEADADAVAREFAARVN